MGPIWLNRAENAPDAAPQIGVRGGGIWGVYEAENDHPKVTHAEPF